nr:hypothetical protein [Tanacetum cinerariifolium]
MALTFADTHNMIAYLTKSDASECFEQILDFLNASVIKYALTVNPTIYISCIKQFWSSVSIKKTNDVVRLQSLIDRRKVIITEDTIRQALRLDDAESIDCLIIAEIFAELERMSAKRTTWNEFSSSMASAVICLATWMLVPHQVNDVVTDDVADVTTDDVADEGADVVAEDAAEPTPPSPTLAITPPPPPQDLPSTSQIAQALEITKLKQRVRKLEKKRKLKVFGLKRLSKIRTSQRVKSSADTVMDDQEDASKQRKIDELDADEDVTLEEVATVTKGAKVTEKDADAQGRLEESQAQVYHIDLEHAYKVLSMQDDEPEPVELKEVIEVVTTAKLITEVVTAAATTIIAAPITAAPSAARRRKGVVIRDPEETATPSTIVHSEPKSNDKGKGILVEEPKPLKKQAQIEQDEAYARELKAELNKNINWDDVIEQEAASKALKRKSKSSEQQAAKKQKLDEEVEELKTHLQIVPNDENDVYTEDTPLALKVPVVDYQIHTENNKPHYKIIRADGTHQLFLSFISLLRNFNREDLEMLWQIVQERFASSKPKNFSDDFLLTTRKAMFEKPDVEAHIWKNERDSYGFAKVKSWKLLESCGVYIITFTTTHMILLVERRYPLTRFTLDQMLNNVRLEVKEESKVSLELLRFVRRRQQEGYRPE